MEVCAQCPPPPQPGTNPCCALAAPEKSPPELSDMMQADGPRACRFGRHWYMNNESWHPTVPPFGEMKCITCWCVVSDSWHNQHRCWAWPHTGHTPWWGWHSG